MCFGLMITCDKLKVNGDDREENKVTHRPFGIKQHIPGSQEDNISWKMCLFRLCYPPTEHVFLDI